MCVCVFETITPQREMTVAIILHSIMGRKEASWEGRNEASWVGRKGASWVGRKEASWPQSSCFVFMRMAGEREIV